MNSILQSLVQRLPGYPERFVQRMIEPAALVLIYHRVAPLESDPQLLNVSPDNFNEQVSWLKQNTTLLGIEEFTYLKTNFKKFPKRASIITFDDGYYDNCQFARPILESNNAQGLFYITTSNLNTQKELWWDELERIFLTTENLPTELQVNVAGTSHQFSTSSEKELLDVYHAFHPLLKWQKSDKREETLDFLRHWAGLNENGRPSHRLMNWGELAVMAQSKAVEIGAHTHTHAPVSVFTPAEQYKDILESKKILEDFLKRKMIHFSFPFGGQKDFTNQSKLICEAMGFKLVCANYPGQVFRYTSNYEIPRILIRDWNKDQFARNMNSYFTY